MSSDAVRITDKKLISETFKTRFINRKVFVKTGDINIQADSFSYNDGNITMTAPGRDKSMDSVIFYARDEDQVVFAHAVLKSEGENGLLVFEPLDVQIMKIPRREERKSVAEVGAGTKAPVYISNIISDFTIHECLDLSSKKVDLIRDELLKKIQAIYSDSEIIFLNDKSNDPRMLYFKIKRKPYFIRNIHEIENPEELTDDDLKYYKSYIQPKDQFPGHAKISSEICVPLLYKMMLPFGYVKAAKPDEFTDEDFSVIRKFGMSASTVYTNDRQIIVSSDDNIAVTDLSISGLGIFFREKILIKHFKEHSLILFTVFLPEKKQATMLCEVKNISLIKNYVYRIGCEVLNIEALGEVHYSEYLESL